MESRQDWTRKAKDIKPELNQAVAYLQTCQNYVSTESTEAFKSLREASNLTHIQAELGEHLSAGCYASLFVPMYKSLKETSTNKTSDSKTREQASTNLYNMMTAFAQFTAESSHLCTELQSGETLTFLMGHLTEFVSPLDKQDKNSLREITLILEILYHCIRFSSDLRMIYRKQGLVPVLTSYLNTSEVLIKTTSLVILAYVVDESESDKLATTGTDGCVNFLVFRLKSALHSRVHRAGGFTAAGLLEGLIHLMASDANKVKVMEQGAVPLILRMLKTAEKKPFSVEEQVLAATAIWKFAFIDSNRPALKKNEDVMTALNDHKTSKNAALRDACFGALWEIHEGEIKIEEHRDDTAQNSASKDSSKASADNKTYGDRIATSAKAIFKKKSPADTAPSAVTTKARDAGVVENREADQEADREVATDAPHIMISYQWDSQPLMIRVKNALQQAGYNVWMDVDKMEGNILMAMANAVEKAAVVLVAMSHKYKESNNCRTEASYAYKKKKPIIPLLVEDEYDPDGWLGALVGMLLYYQVTDQETLIKQLPPIMKELGSKGKIGSAVSLPNPTHTHTAKPSTTKPTPEKPNHEKPNEHQPTQAASRTATAPCVDWTTEQVQKWLNDNDLSHLKESMKSYDGKCLAQMRMLSQRCPEYYHNALKTEFGLDLLAVVKLSIAMDDLFK